MQGNVSVARKEFEVAQRSRNNGRRSVSGYIALARLECKTENYAKALSLYRKALEQCPSCPAEVRLAIGVCHFYLGNTRKAASAYTRALELDPECVQALLGLAVIELVDTSDDASVKAGSKTLLKAYNKDPTNPYTLTLLAHLTLQQEKFDVSLRFANAALDKIPLDESSLRAETTGILGRLYHAKGELDKAADYYQQAINIDKSLRAPRLALAQLSTLKRDLLHAGRMYQSLMHDYPNWIDVATHFGPLIPYCFKYNMITKDLIDEFAKVVEQEATNVDLWENLGDILCKDKPAKALRAYATAIKLYQDTLEDTSSLSGIPTRLLNNAAVLYLRTGQVSLAFRLINGAIDNAQHGGLGNLHPASQVTLGYNMARIREASGDLNIAEKEYQELLKEFPKYVDCLLRLACIAKKKGKISDAEQWARRAAEVSSNSADALALLAGIHLERRDLASAKKLLEELQGALPPGASNIETYGRVALGNIHLYSIPGEIHYENNYEKAAVHLAHAMGLFRRALERDPGNLFAANGIGCVLAEAGRLSEAKDIFLRVQETSAATDGFVTIPDAWINLASVQLGLNQSRSAEATYQQAMRKHHGLQLDPRLLLYLAKAQYEADKTQEATKTVAKALHLAPSDHRLRFNLAYLMQQGGAKVLQQNDFPGEASKVEAYGGAVMAFENSHRVFSGLQQLGQSKTGIAGKKLEHHIAFAFEMHQSAVAKHQLAQKEAAAAASRKTEQQIRRKAAEKAREMEQKRLEAAAQASAKREEELAVETQQHLKRLKEAWKHGTVLEKAAAEGDAGAVQSLNATQGSQEMADPIDALFAMDEDEIDDDYDPEKEERVVEPPPAEAEEDGKRKHLTC